MIKKILWFILLILVLYIVLIFVSPSSADKIGDALGIKHFNETIRITKDKADEIYTNLPTKEEWKDAYEKTLSGAENLKNQTISGAYVVKDKVDDLRENLNNTADQYNELKEQFNETKEQVEAGLETIKNVSEAFSSGTTNKTNSSGTTIE